MSVIFWLALYDFGLKGSTRLVDKGTPRLLNVHSKMEMLNKISFFLEENSPLSHLILKCLHNFRGFIHIASSKPTIIISFNEIQWF